VVNNRTHTYFATLVIHKHTHTQSLANDSATQVASAQAEADKFCARPVRSNYMSYSMAEKFSHTRYCYMYYQCAILTKDKEATTRN
jgi:hypothetical protein